MADYLYGSGRIRALENRLLGGERIRLLLQEPTVQEVWSRLTEYGVSPILSADGTPDLEATLQAIQRRAAEEVRECAGNAPAVLFGLYPYDCNNVKVALKAFAMQADPRPMMVDFATVSAEEVISMTWRNDFSGLPPYMAKAAGRARESHAMLQNPQQIDFLMDQAVFADMLAAVRGEPFLTELTRLRIDLANMHICVRILRRGLNRRMLEQVLIAGGSIGERQWLEVFAGGEPALEERLSAYFPRKLTVHAAQDGSPSLLAVAADNLYMEKLREVKYLSFGKEIPAVYLAAVEYEVRNLRILLTMKSWGFPAGMIEEKLRHEYV